MRLFVAIKTSESVRDNIRRVADQLRATAPEALQRANWVKPKNLHLTLKFLGEVAENRIESLGRALMEVSKSHRPFSLRVKGAGAFPRRSRAHVFWAGVEDPDKHLASLANSVEKACVSAGLAVSDKPFSPHITFARFSAPLLKSADILEPHLESPLGGMDVDRFYLIHSVLEPSGAAYKDLREFRLSGS